MKKISIVILSIVLLLFCSSCTASKTTASSASSTSNASASKTITDSLGRKVTVPGKINKVADSWFAHNEVLSILGAGDKIVATSLSKKAQPWLYVVNPSMNKALVTFGTNFNAEDLLKNKPDVIFASKTDTYIDKVSSLGIPVVQVSFTNFDSMKKCVTLTSEILGGSSIERAKEFNSYLDSKLKMIKSVTSKIPESKKPKVLHIQSIDPLQVDGSDTIIDDWINVAGGVNVAKDIKGNMKEISVEQILKWNPDIIIVGTNTDSGDEKNSVNDILNNPALQQVSAVKNKKVYQNPSGAFNWDRYGCEEALQIQWAAKIINPDKFKNLDITSETKNFYKTFLNYKLSNDDVDRILKGENPVD